MRKPEETIKAKSNEIPLNWVEVPLEAVIDNFKRGPFGSAIKKSFFVPQGFKVYEQQNAIYDDPQRGSYYISQQKYDELQAFHACPGDFIVSCSGTIGKISRLPDDAQAGIINQALLRMRLNLNVFDPKLFLLLFRSESFQKRILVETRGSAMKNITGVKELRLVSVKVPPLFEQHRIVAKIEELFSDLDAGVETLKLVQQQLNVYRQAVLKWAFEGKLTEWWRYKQEQSGCRGTLGQLLQDIAVRFTESKKTGNKASRESIQILDVDKLPSLPDGWLYIKADLLSDFITKGTTPPKHEMFEGGGGIPFIKVYNLTMNGTLDFTVDPTFVSVGMHEGFLNRSKVLPGDVLMNIVGPPLGKVSLVPNTFPEWNINQAVVRFRSNGALLPKFLAYYLLSRVTVDRMARRAKATAGQFNLTLEICRDLEIPLTVITEQQQIVDEIEKRLSVCEEVEKSISENLQRSEALRQGILTMAFEGKLVPQDPKDEPADELLKRISEQRSQELVLGSPTKNKQQTKKKTRTLAEV